MFPCLTHAALSTLFAGKPMLWRFFGVWGNCVRSGQVTFLNLDFCTGGRLKNAAFYEASQKGLHTCNFDVGWTLEARSDDEMPEVSAPTCKARAGHDTRHGVASSCRLARAHLSFSRCDSPSIHRSV